MIIKRAFAPITITIQTEEEARTLNRVLFMALDNSISRGFCRKSLPDDITQIIRKLQEILN